MSGRKVKFKLVQPQIKCSGRDDVTCTYRGKVISENDMEMTAEINVYGEPTQIFYDKMDKKVRTPGFEDLKLQ